MSGNCNEKFLVFRDLSFSSSFSTFLFLMYLERGGTSSEMSSVSHGEEKEEKGKSGSFWEEGIKFAKALLLWD